MGSRMRVIVVVVLVVAAIAGGLVYLGANRQPTEKFCTMALGFTSVHGRHVVNQDQGGPGKDGCDLPDHGEYTNEGPTLGFDCKVRDAKGRVIDSLPRKPNGSCDSSAP